MAEEAGIPEVAASLRAAADETAANATAVDVTVRAVERAAADADRAADQLSYATQQAKVALYGVPIASGAQ
ncbi:MAG: hypothetical protein GEV28_03345 [Actinophytocola sp.]|nr:hypothetical protein [Actinophytocola sp.]